MTSFNAIKITGIDASRPPRIRKESYVDLFYQLSEDAPEDWCEAFNAFGRHVNPMAKVDAANCSIINTYVNDIDAIPAHFEQIKQAVADCNAQHLEKLKQREMEMARDNADLQEQGGAQFKLNQIIASLDFDA
jgi:hypothetical protein